MHTYVYICDSMHVHIQEAEQPSRQKPYVSVRTKVTMQDGEKKPKTTWNTHKAHCKNSSFGIAIVLSARSHKH